MEKQMTQAEKICQEVTDRHITDSPNEFTGINTGVASFVSISFLDEAMKEIALKAWISKHKSDFLIHGKIIKSSLNIIKMEFEQWWNQEITE